MASWFRGLEILTHLVGVLLVGDVLDALLSSRVVRNVMFLDALHFALVCPCDCAWSLRVIALAELVRSSSQ